MIPESFPGFVAEHRDGAVERGVRNLSPADLPTGEVLIRVRWSGVNYKDGLAASADGKVARISPLVPGVDLAGEVVSDATGAFSEGDEVIVHGYALGVAHHGGYAAYARVPVGWVLALPSGLSARDAMVLGTAGFTAGLSVQALQHRGLGPHDGPVLVTGASGGVGSMAVGMLARLGYDVVASSGKADTHDWLRALGAAEVVGREEVLGDGDRPMRSQRWAAAVDCVGGATLAAILTSLRYGGAVAASGNAGGARLETTVLPFILRGVALLGVDSVQVPLADRKALWERLAGDLRPTELSPADEIGLDGVEQALERILAGGARGRTVVRLEG